jgi:glutamate-ammonia-ligase adenylyltransferase
VTGPERVQTTVARLARSGFTDPAAAQRALADSGFADEGDSEVIDAVAATADPDLAAATLGRLLLVASDADDVRAALRADDDFRVRLLDVLGASTELGEHLVRHPDQWHALLDEADGLSRPSRWGLRDTLAGAVQGKTGTAARDALRIAYRRCLLKLAARDLAGRLDVGDVAGELADLAEATLAAALDVAMREHPSEARIAVIGMGKCGGRELNYVSDVDVIFVAEPADQQASAVAAAMMRVCSDVTSEGSIWPVDAALRPEGKAGPLVRTVASHVSYYERWARTWEFQALLKARPVAGDEELAQAYVDGIRPLVWSAARREDFVADVQAMRRRVLDNVPASEVEREVKLGPGGLRDVEFAVQLLQLVHGSSDSHQRRLCRPRRRAAARRGVLLPAHRRASTAAAAPSSHSPTADCGARPAVAGAGDGVP